MKYKDYYKILGISRDALQTDIKKTYRRLARKYHPDVSKEPNAEARFKEINEAYEALKDPQKRATYDDLGNQWHSGQEFRPPPGGQRFHQEFNFGSGDAGQFSDFFSSLFGAAPGRGATGRGRFRDRGDDHTATIQVTVEEAYQGSTRRLQVDGVNSRNLDVRIPPGVTEGQKIRLTGQGQPGPLGGPSGDIYLQIELRPHHLYQVDGKDLTVDLPITPWEAALGAAIAVPTPGGAVNLKIPAGSQSGRKLRLKGRGLPGKPAGDEYVILQIQVPPADSEQAKAFYKRMAEEMPFNPRAEF